MVIVQVSEKSIIVGDLAHNPNPWLDDVKTELRDGETFDSLIERHEKALEKRKKELKV